MNNTTDDNGFFPVNLMLENRSCLVVGGGKVAAHKARRLLDAGAFVTVIAPQCGEELTAIAKEDKGEKITIRKQVFTDGDVEGMFLVFAASSNLKTNYRIVEAARQQGALVCATDKSWTQGDFITPATIRKDELTLAISTGGRSCRRSRLVKKNIARHVEMVETARLLVMGTSHNYLSLEQREPFHLVECKLERTGQMLMQAWGVHEFMLLNTCNRVELMAIVSQDASVDLLLERVLGFDSLGPEHYYVKHDSSAFEHSCILNAGLLSQTPGEKHIVSQVKEALENAKQREWSGSMMEDWISSALHVAKDIRSETKNYLESGEIEDMAVSYLDEVCGILQDKRIMVLGTGDIGKGVIERCSEKRPRYRCEWFYNKNKPEIPSLTKNYVQLYSMNAFKDRIGEADVVICATGSSGHVLHQGHAPFFDQEKELLIVDLAMPRNVAPELENLAPRIDVVDLDDLKYWYRHKAADFARVYEISKDTVGRHKELYDKIMHSFQGQNASE